MSKTLYDLLEVSPNATPEHIEESMARLSRKFADNHQVDSIAFDEIKTAYQILSSPYRRTAYDVSLEADALAKRQQRHFVANLAEDWQAGREQRAARWAYCQNQCQRFFKRIIRFLQILWFILQKIYQTIQWIILKIAEKWYGTTLHRQINQKIVQQREIENLNRSLLATEVIIYRTRIHWLFCIDIGAILLIVGSLCLLIINPYSLRENTPLVEFWLPAQWVETLPQVSVWNLGLSTLLFIGLLMLLEAFIEKQTTELTITSRRIIVRLGFLYQKIIEIKLNAFESVTVYQNILGRIFNYGNLTITGLGRIQVNIPHIVAPLKFRQTLWQLFEQKIKKKS